MGESPLPSVKCSLARAELVRCVLVSPLGALTVELASTGNLAALEWGATKPCADQTLAQHPLVRELGAELEAYFKGQRALFDIPLELRGTPFQQRVWQALCAIPAGQVRTYGDLARQLGTAPRAIGGACRTNPVAILVPCHRVVARDGLGGYTGETSGTGLEIKRWLLSHERQYFV